MFKQPFPLGKVVQTIAVSEILSDNDIHQLIRKQSNYDWGNVCQSDWLLNDLGANGQGRVVSSHTVNGETVFVITEADRSSTTIMFSYEY
ncbi:hypothetical protein BKL49_02845 [Rodentibacter myodis]|uniref:Type I restriction endonuclease subunit M n=1 Tax=Rodentibacter myodis TaxID=1907939 RepID=A0A1V3JT28_9PAST|nr:hypothetical protein BKL49_02845 [Rodentibacter myodis]